MGGTSANLGGRTNSGFYGGARDRGTVGSVPVRVPYRLRLVAAAVYLRWHLTTFSPCPTWAAAACSGTHGGFAWASAAPRFWLSMLHERGCFYEQAQSRLRRLWCPRRVDGGFGRSVAGDFHVRRHPGDDFDHVGAVVQPPGDPGSDRCADRAVTGDPRYPQVRQGLIRPRRGIGRVLARVAQKAARAGTLPCSWWRRSPRSAWS